MLQHNAFRQKGAEVVRTRKCESCGRSYQAKNSRSRFCGQTCYRRHSRANPKPKPVAAARVEAALVDAVRVELEAAGRLDSVAGQSALRLAEKMCGSADTGSGLAALSRELRGTMAEALQGANVADDLVDELKRRRDAKRAAAG